MAAKNRIYPIFLPHAGCPFQCVYCNQHSVTSASPGESSAGPRKGGPMARFHEQFAPLAEYARHTCAAGEVAFYGGTFTALPLEILQRILDDVSPWVENGTFTGIRFSTRPDGITEEVCTLLSAYPIRTVELGVQSLCDEVLAESCRGYGVETVESAAALVRRHSWKLGIQMMAGLPGDTRRTFLQSILRAIDLHPEFVRLYPTLVIRGTPLADWHARGIYRPLSLEEAVCWCVSAFDAFLRANIAVARMGLHADAELQKPGVVLAGPYHPAFGYLVRSRWWRDRVDTTMRPGIGRFLTLRVPHRCVSEVLGPLRSNLQHWQEKWHLERVRVRGESDWTQRELEFVWE